MEMEEKDLKLAFADTVELIPVSSGDNTKGVAPDEFVVIKFGKNKYTMDGEEDEFEFDEEDADKVIDEFNRRGKDLLIDMEHASQIPGKPAPAYGWVKKLEKCRDGLLAKLANWSDDAKKYLEKREYRYHSPVIYFDENKKNHPKSIHSIGLTNHPAIHNLTPLVANDSEGENETFEDRIPLFEKAIEKLKCQIDFNHEYLCLNDKRHLAMLQDSLVDNLSKYKSFLNTNAPEEAEDMFQAFSDKLFLSDISDRAVAIINGYSGEDAIMMLEDLKRSEGISQTEIQYIDALIEDKREDIKEGIFNDNKVISNSNEGVQMSKLAKQLKRVHAYADMDEDVAMTLEQELAAEELPVEEEGMDVMAEEVSGVAEIVKAIMSQLKELAKALEVDVAEEGMAEEEMDQVALFDKAIKRVKEIKAALSDISEVFEVEVDLNKIGAFSDVVVKEHLVTPRSEEVQAMVKKLAMSDAENRTEKAKALVEKAIARGTIFKCKEEAALKRAIKDPQGFSDSFLSDDALVVVPVSINDDEASVSNSEDKDAKTKLSLSDTQLEVGKKFGRSQADLEKIYNKENK